LEDEIYEMQISREIFLEDEKYIYINIYIYIFGPCVSQNEGWASERKNDDEPWDSLGSQGNL
jgi:hypothetical protein